MFFSAAVLTSLFAFFQGSDATNQYSDELFAAMIQTVQQNPQILAAASAQRESLMRPPPASVGGLRGEQSPLATVLADKPSPNNPKPKPDPKPKPGPKNYMIFSNHIDDATCGESSLIEAHGFVIDECFTGVGGLLGLYWSFSVTNDETNYFLNYGFYSDSLCATTPVVSAVETVPYGCAARGQSGGHDRTKRFFTSTKIPDYKRGVLFNGYQTAQDCQKSKSNQIVDWSFVKNNECDPQIHSPVYGGHTTDETRTCSTTGGRRKDPTMVAVLYDSNDMTCSGAVTTTTTINDEWDCQYGSNVGPDGVYREPKCV